MSHLQSVLFYLLISAAVVPLHMVAQAPSFIRNASVHDPSVIKVGDRFYVFGSHGASAWSDDLRNWTQVASTVTAGSPPHFATFQSELSEMIAWTNANTLWAADVIQLEDGKFYYYYNVWTDFNSYRSYMGLAVSDQVEGPYIDQGEIMRGGTGVSGFNPSIHPNTIDPTLFRDADDALWMVYGSYSGGIFILEMNDQTGMPLPGQGWGKRLMGGNHAVMEGPFIDYNPDTEFYYLYLSYGGLSAADGYNMRVFRSENPDGPYVDPKGTNMETAAVNSSLASIDPHGLKLAGNWQFTPLEGEPATSSTGYLSPGHNSVMRDPESGKWFNFFHTRFVGRGESHEIRVHQLFYNEDGWPVMAPHRYAGETQGVYSAADLAGLYKVINHGKDTSGAVKTSSVIELLANGALAGVSGSWVLADGQHIRISADGILYKGVVSEQWDNENRRWVLGFSAIGPEGEALWGSQAAILDRSGEQNPPQLAPLPDVALSAGEVLSLTLVNQQTGSDLVLEHEILAAPQGLRVDPATWAISWEPLASQFGKVYPVRIKVYDLIDPSLSDEVNFTVYAGGGYDAQSLELGFDAPATGGIADSAGIRTGLSARLSGTGVGMADSDPNLALDAANSRILLKSAASDFNGQTGIGLASAVGVRLSELGFTGVEDFTITADFGEIAGLQSVDQVGVFVGSSATTLTRAGIIQFASPEGFSAHTQSGADTAATFDQSGFDLSEGLTVTISRDAGLWSYVVNGIAVSPQVPNAAFLDEQDDLVAGVFALNPTSGVSKTIGLDSFSAAVLSGELRITRIQQWRSERFGLNPVAGVAGNEDDPDGDGRTNLLEYAQGTNPMAPDADPQGKLEVVDGELVWTFQRIEDPALVYEVWASVSPAGPFDELLFRSAAGSNQVGTAQVVAPLPSDGNPGRFLQLRVNTAE